MLRYEDSLPRLPVPSLQETIQRYLRSVQGLLGPNEYEKTKKAAENFLGSGQIGEELQKRLLARREDPKHKNWIYEWWNDAAYLTYRDPVVPYVSYFYSHRDDRHRRQPAKKAAALTAAVLEFKKQVDSGTLEPEYMKRLPVSMESYQWMFNACRMPGEGRDYPVKYDRNEHKHIVVIHKNQFFQVPHEIEGTQLNALEFERQFSLILSRAEKAPAVGALTVQNRDLWNSSRQHLLEAHASNRTALELIQSASFLVCFDDASPVTLEERAHQFWHGDGQNRWYDKPLQFVINSNGTSGFLGEHSMMDGTPTHRLNDYISMLIFSGKLEKLDRSHEGIRSSLPEPKPISFTLNDTVKSDIHRAVVDFENVIGQHELRVQAYQRYGKGLIKQFKCSPDAYVQLVVQLAYYKMFGRSRPTYESATTRRFQQGRTETCRSVSRESVGFCQGMADPSTSSDECITLFRAALDGHVKYISDASDGRGVDRHLFGLKKCLEEGEEVPALFKDPTYAYSSTWYLSTSQLSSEYLNGYGWSQVVDEGFGIAYMINENRLAFLPIL